MSEPYENALSHSQAIRIAGLIHKTREKEALTEEEQQELNTWVNSSETNAQTLAALQDREQVIREIGALQQYQEEKAVEAIFKELGRRPPSAVVSWKTTIRRLSIAASFLVLAGAGWWLYTKQVTTVPPFTVSAATYPGPQKAILTLADGRQVELDSLHTPELALQGSARVAPQKGRLVYTAAGNGAQAYNTLTTPRGAQYQLQLADGSEIWLNAATSVTYPTAFTGSSREVTINGEAFFKVAKDKTKPFYVTARDMKVQVVGTQFNVMAYSDEDTTRTTLLEGVVKTSVTNASTQQETLKPGEQAALGYQSGVLKKGTPDLEAVISWRSGQRRFHDTDMRTIMRQIARWYDVNIEYGGPVDTINFTGPITRTEKIKDLLDIVSDTRLVHFRIKNDTTIIVIPGPR